MEVGLVRMREPSTQRQLGGNSCASGSDEAEHDAETNKAEKSSADTEPRLWRNARRVSTNDRLAAESESSQAE
ncbi:hypothetical protein FOVSG1_009380 [Fusarium oxysporum f. sp. vasinfectum]